MIGACGPGFSIEAVEVVGDVVDEAGDIHGTRGTSLRSYGK